MDGARMPFHTEGLGCFFGSTHGENPLSLPRCPVQERQRGGLFRSWSQLLAQGGQRRMLRLFSAVWRLQLHPLL